MMVFAVVYQHQAACVAQDVYSVAGCREEWMSVLPAGKYQHEIQRK